MSMAVIGRRALLLALCLAIQLSAGASVAVSFTTASLKGRWTTHLEPATSFAGNALGDPAGVTAAPRQHVMRVGYIDWDGLGGASGRFLATTDTNSGQTMEIDYQWSGSYTVNPDGTGALTITTIKVPPDPAPAPVCTPDPPPEGGVCTDYIAPSPLSPVPAYVGPETFALTISKRFSTVSLVQQNNVGGAKIFLQGEAERQFHVTTPFFFTSGSLTRTWALRLEPVTSFAAIAPGDPAGVATAPRQNFLRVGYISWTGLTIASGRMIATTEDKAGTTITIDYTWQGLYTVNSDGTGTLNVSPIVTDSSCTPMQAPTVCATLIGPETYAFTISKSHLQMFLMQTSTAVGAKIFLRGAAQAQ